MVVTWFYSWRSIYHVLINILKPWARLFTSCSGVGIYILLIFKSLIWICIHIRLACIRVRVNNRLAFNSCIWVCVHIGLVFIVIGFLGIRGVLVPSRPLIVRSLAARTESSYRGCWFHQAWVSVFELRLSVQVGRRLRPGILVLHVAAVSVVLMRALWVCLVVWVTESVIN